MMLTMIVSMKARPGEEAALEDVLGALLVKVAGEPGSGGVVWGRRTDSGGYTVVERYRDEAALAAHGEATHMAELGPAVLALLDGEPTFHIITEL